MELVYLWVEKYKNIENQGFNFSPRFECEFFPEYEKDTDGKKKLKDNCKLEIKPKEHVSIFPDNINVTAIVGENGSGKTTIFEIVSKLFINKDFDNEVIFVINLEGTLLCNKDDLGLQNINNAMKLSIYNGVYYSPNFTNSGLNSLIENFATPLLYKHEKETIQQNNSLSPEDNIKNQSLLNMYLNSPRFIERHPTISHYRQKDAFTIDEYNNYIDLAKSIMILSFMENFGKEFLNINNQNNYVEISIHENKVTNNIRKSSFLEAIENLFEIKKEFLSDKNKEEEYKKKLDEFLIFCKQKIDNNLETHQAFTLHIHDTSILINSYLELYWLNRSLDFNILDFKYKNLSSGEENLFLMFSLISSGAIPYIEKEDKPSNITIFLDEIENNIHPNKQKELLSKIIIFLNIIINNVNNEYHKKVNFNIVIASHSPFILSDLPKENVVFLEKNENGNCINVSKDVKINTFGANIHTLLSHGFFMKDGLMGEFAKEKINDVINYLNNKESAIKDNDEAQKLLNIIGEPIIKNQLQRMLDSKRLSKVDKIDKLEEELELIKHRIEKIRKNQ